MAGRLEGSDHISFLANRTLECKYLVEVGGGFWAPIGDPNAELQAAVAFLLHFQKGSSDVAHVWSCEGAQIAFTDPNGPSPKLIGELAQLGHQSSQPGHHKVSGRWREQIRDTNIGKASKLLGQLVVERRIQAPHPE